MKRKIWRLSNLQYIGKNNRCGNGKGNLGITVFFQKDPTEFMSIFEDRLKKFPKSLAKSWEFSETNVKIKSIQLIKEHIDTEIVYTKEL